MFASITKKASWPALLPKAEAANDNKHGQESEGSRFQGSHAFYQEKENPKSERPGKKDKRKGPDKSGPFRFAGTAGYGVTVSCTRTATFGDTGSLLFTQTKPL